MRFVRNGSLQFFRIYISIGYGLGMMPIKIIILFVITNIPDILTAIYFPLLFRVPMPPSIQEKAWQYTKKSIPDSGNCSEFA